MIIVYAHINCTRMKTLSRKHNSRFDFSHDHDIKIVQVCVWNKQSLNLIGRETAEKGNFPFWLFDAAVSVTLK